MSAAQPSGYFISVEGFQADGAVLLVKGFSKFFNCLPRGILRIIDLISDLQQVRRISENLSSFLQERLI
jgi:hypothetical protein